MSIAEQILQAITVTAELTSTTFSEPAKVAMVEELLNYEPVAVMAALNRCRKELTGRLTLAAVLDRIDTGLPGANEAWNLIVEGWRHEELTVVMPEIAQLSASSAFAIWDGGDKVGARMAFLEDYERRKANADIGNIKWVVSAGTDHENRARRVLEAVKQGKLPSQTAHLYLPTEATEERHLLLTGQVMTKEQKQLGKQKTQGLLAYLGEQMAMRAEA